MNTENEIRTISLVAHENVTNRLYKVIRLLTIAIIVICTLFVGYIAIDRYLDTSVDVASSVEQNANDNGTNAYNGGDYIVSESND